MSAEQPLVIFDPATLREIYEDPHIVGCGIDICDVEKMRRNMGQNPTFITDNFTDGEIVYCEQAADPLRAQRYTARFAAKEAVTKVLGINGLGVSFLDIGVMNTINGEPYIFLRGEVKRHADVLGVYKISISLCHEGNVAAAFCLAWARKGIQS